MLWPHVNSEKILDKNYEAGNKIVDAEGVPTATPAFVQLGDFNPDFTAGLSSRMNFGNLSLNILINAQQGGDILSLTDLYIDGNGNSTRTLGIRETGIIVDGVTEQGEANTVTASAQDYFGGIAQRNILEDYVYDASFIKFKELSLSYRLPSRLLTKTPFNGASISLVGRNLFFISRSTDNFDPETASYNARNSQGIEFYSLPSTRSIGFDLSLSF